MSVVKINNMNKVGRPRIITAELEAQVVVFLFKETLENGSMPKEETAAKHFGISERSIRSIRLKYGLDRWTIRRLLVHVGGSS